MIKWLNDARIRSLVAGAIGGLSGWILAEGVFGTPGSIGPTLGTGLFVGCGIGALLGVSEGLVIQSWALAKRGLLIGLLIGAAGGAIGATLGQLTYAMVSSNNVVEGEAAQGGTIFAPGSFDEDIQARIDTAEGTAGEIEIALVWENKNDLDLHVIDPNGEEIYWDHRSSQSNGVLDIDKNLDCKDNITSEPIEHVYWAKEDAPLGEYFVYVNYFKHCQDADPSDYKVQVKIGAEVESFTGSISNGDEKRLIHRFVRQEAPPPVPAKPVRSFSLLNLLAAIFGWTLFGALVGCAEGIRRRSAEGLRNAAIGGAVGGSLGGLALVVFALVTTGVSPDAVEQVLETSHGGWPGRLAGFVILGACIGLWIVLIERALSAVLMVRSGRSEGRVIYLDRAEMRMGRNDALEIFLGGDTSIASHHATLRQESGGHVLSGEQGTVLVNDQSVQRQRLQNGDAITLGNMRFVYRHRAAPQTAEPAETAGTSGKTGARPAPPLPPPGKKTSPAVKQGNEAAPQRTPPKPDGESGPSKGPRRPPPPPPRRK